MGVAVVDIGGTASNVAVFFDNSIRHSSTVPLGGKNVTNDVAIGLRTPIEQAEAIKINFGAALSSLVDADTMISVPGVGSRSMREISRSVLASIVGPRMEEILSLAHREIKKANFPEALAAGVVLTGGGSLLPGAAELAEQVFDMPVRIGLPLGFEGMTETVATPLHATGIGLIRYGVRHGDEVARKSKTRGLFRRVEKWFNEHF